MQKREMKQTATKTMGELLAELGSTVVLSNRDMGCAVALRAGKRGFKHQAHIFAAPGAFDQDGVLTKQAWKEIHSSGILPAVGHGARSSKARLMARGAAAAAVAGFCTLGLGLTDAHAWQYVYTGGTNPLDKVFADYPRPAFVDIDGDGDQDAFVGEEYGGVLFFRNTGNSQNPSFAQISEGNPLTVTMSGDYACPAFVDIDGDGDMDCFVGTGYYDYNHGWADSTVLFFENTGTNRTPVFTQREGDDRKAVSYNPLAYVDIRYAVPTFADIDGDGDMDAFIGSQNGYIYGYENVTGEGPLKNGNGAYIQFEPRGPLREAEGKKEPNGYYYNYIDVGSFAAPVFGDMDHDGDLDLLVGNGDGKVKYYENMGDSEDFAFTKRWGEDNPLNIDLVSHAKPALVDINGDGLMDAFVGDSWDYYAENRKQQDMYDFGAGLAIRYYQNTGTVQEPKLRSRGDNPFNLGPDPILPNITLGDVDGDGDLDSLVGHMSYFWWLGFLHKDQVEQKGPPMFSKGMFFYENTGTPEDAVFKKKCGRGVLDDEQFEAFSSPALADLDGDGRAEAYVGTLMSRQKLLISPVMFPPAIESLEYITQTEEFVYSCSNPFDDLDIPNVPSPSFVDIDGDGDLDAFVGGVSYCPDAGEEMFNSTISFFINEGTPITPSLAPITFTNPLSGVFPITGAMPISYTSYLAWPRCTFADIDGDGDFDMIMQDSRGLYSYDRKDNPPDYLGSNLRYFQNTGSRTNAVFVEAEGENNPFRSVGDKVLIPSPAAGDLDNDGDADILFGDILGRFYYYTRIADLDEAVNFLKDKGWELCFVDSADSDKSAWTSLMDSCRQGLTRIKEFFSPS